MAGLLCMTAGAGAAVVQIVALGILLTGGVLTHCIISESDMTRCDVCWGTSLAC